MILQRDPRLRPEIQEWGCYLMSILFLANKMINIPIDPVLINEFYISFLKRGWMTKSCKILKPQEIFDYLACSVHYTDRWEPADYNTADNEIEILCFTYNGKTHFCAGDGHGHVAYDPWGESDTVRLGRLESKRIFRRL